MKRRLIVAILFGLCVAASSRLIFQPVQAQSGNPAVDKSVSIDGLATALTTPAFTTSAPSELVVAFVAADGPSNGGQTATVSGAGLSWTLARRVNARLGTAEIWTAPAAGILSNATVTSTLAAAGFYQSLNVVTFTNAGGIGNTGGADGANGAPSVSLTTTQSGSLAYAVGNDWDNAVARTLGPGQSMLDEYLAPVGDTFWVQYLTAPTAAAGVTVQLNDTAPTADRWNFAAVEIVPPQGPGFVVVAYNDTMTAGLSDSVTYNMLISPFGGFTGPLQCAASAVPPGATGVTAPAGGPPHPGPIAMTVTTGPATPPGTYHPVTTCTAGTLSASATLTLVVTAQPDLRVVLEPNSLTLAQGQAGVANFQLQAMNGYAQGINMSVTGLPAGVTPTFTPATLFPSGSGTLQLAVGGAVPAGIYNLTVRAISNDATLTRTAPFTLTVLQPNGSGTWRQQALVDTPAQFYGSIVGDVGNTGKTRVYASGGDGLMYELPFNGTSWSVVRVPFGVTGDGEMHNGVVGPGRADGINRLYIAANLSGLIYEASWVNNAWQVTTIGTYHGASDVFIGDGRNDGRTRVYISWEAGATELTRNGNSWTQVTMGDTEGGEVHGIEIAQARNDGINRVYTANDADGTVSEYSWNGTAWNKVVMGNNGDVRNIAFGAGRNDGKIRGYAAAGNGNVYEYSWSGTAWQNVSIGNAGVSSIKVHANPVKAKTDNLVRVYSAAADGGVYEYFWTGSAWQTTRLGLATAYMYGLDQGDGLNKGTMQLYGVSYDGNAYLFEWMPANPPALVTVPGLIGLQQSSVAGVLSGAGLLMGTSTSQDNSVKPIGEVVGQSPAGGSQAAQGSAVNITVSNGVAVPPVLSLSESAATSALGGVNLTASVSTATHPTILAGLVISQNPTAGTRVSGGSAVAIVISTGPPPPVLVPDVTTRPLSEAQSLIVQAGLSVGSITYQRSATIPIGSVISQVPGGGSSAPGQSAVNLVVSGGGISINFVGTGVAMQAAETAGFVPKANWNNATGAVRTTALALVDEGGAATTTTLTWRADNTWVLPVTDQAGSRRMMRGYLDTGNTQPTTATIANLPAGQYEIYVYTDGENGAATRTAAYQLSGPGLTTTSVSVTDAANTNFNATFSQSTGAAGNYVRFTALVTSGLTITATPGTSTDAFRRAPLNGIQILPVGPPPPPTADFTIAATPGAITVAPGGSAQYTVNLGALNGFSGSVNLGVSGQPAGATPTFTPASLSAPGSSTLTVATTSGIAAGSWTLTITGTFGALVHTATVTFAVNQPAVPRAISVNFAGTGPSMGAGETAGVIPKVNWNNATGASRTTALALVSDTGTATATTITWRADNGWLTPVTDQAGSRRMMKGYLDTGSMQPTTVTFANVPAGTYDVYVYADGDNGTLARTAAYQISGPGITTTSVNLTDAASTNFNATFTQAVNSNGNYVKFTVTIATGFTITATPGTAPTAVRRAPLNGIQIVPTP